MIMPAADPEQVPAPATNGSAAPAPRRAPSELVDRLIAALSPTPCEVDEYESSAHGFSRKRVFGGQTFAQAITAAAATVAPDRLVHAAQGQFLRPGEPGVPTRYKVFRDSDGQSYSSRRVEALQNDRLILTLSASFQVPESSFSHQTEMPLVTPPESLVSENTIREAQWDVLARGQGSSTLRDTPIELRPVVARDFTALKPEPAVQHFWFRPVAPLPTTSPPMTRAVLAYVSDMMLLSTALLPHGIHWATSEIANAQ